MMIFLAVFTGCGKIKAIDKKIVMSEGETATLQYEIKDRESDNAEIVFTSSDERIARVNESGEVFAEGKGTTIIH